jgi:2-polyprenyl-6-hydroxyphenyl methylase/3-demethylubiquinone-9 3-methyltransferase
MTTASDNFSQAELDKFDELAQRWWDPDGPQKALHALNPARLGYVDDRVRLDGAAVLDVGCGGGLLSEALAQAGATVTAIDLAPNLLKVARLHGLESGIKVDYRETAIEALAAEAPAAFALAIVGAEYMARVLPRGTHQYRDFIKPSELARWLRAAGLELEDVSGLMYEPWRNSARVVSRTDINYLACARRPG